MLPELKVEKYPLVVLAGTRVRKGKLYIDLHGRSFHTCARNLEIFLQDPRRECRICGAKAEFVAVITAAPGVNWSTVCRPAFERAGFVEILTNDHVLPRSKGGSRSPHNYRILCETCNSLRGSGTPDSEVLRMLPAVLKLRQEWRSALQGEEPLLLMGSRKLRNSAGSWRLKLRRLMKLETESKGETHQDKQ